MGSEQKSLRQCRAESDNEQIDPLAMQLWKEDWILGALAGRAHMHATQGKEGCLSLLSPLDAGKTCLIARMRADAVVVSETQAR